VRFGRERTWRRRVRPVVALAALIALLGLAACGRDDDDDGGDGGELATVPGFDGETITVGAITPETGPVEVIGAPLTNGNRVWFEYLNDAEGGIAGQYPVELEVVDSRYQPPTAVQQYNRIKDDVVMLAQLLGTPITTAVLPQLRSDNIVASPASLDSLWVREPQLAPLGAPYQIQAINAIDYWLNSEGSPEATICAMIQDDVYGEAGLEGVEFAGQELGFEVAEVARFAAGDEDFTAQIGQLDNAGCELVFLTGLPTEAGAIFGTAAQAEFAPRWIGQSPMWVDELLDSPLRPYLEQALWVVAEGPEWGDESVPGMADMVDRVERYAPDQEPDFYFTFGYNQARVVTEILEQAVANGDLSREGIVTAMEELGTVSFDEVGGDYEYGSADERTPPAQNTILEVDAKAPFGLAALETNYSSDAADAFEFETEEVPTG
jgi:ABC-type branched-subunit amino acid transport system substrate-binding protein